MTRKHFEAIAKRIRTRREAYDTLTNPKQRFAATAALANLARELADDFEEFNPRFDREHFLAACGL